MKSVVLSVNVYWVSSASTFFWCSATRDSKRSVSGKGCWEDDEGLWAPTVVAKTAAKIKIKISARMLLAAPLSNKCASVSLVDSTVLVAILLIGSGSLRKETTSDPTWSFRLIRRTHKPCDEPQV